MDQPRRYGLLLPHFGPHASREMLTEEAVRLETAGFDALWVRDHVVYEPHEYEHPDPTFLDPFIVLSGIATVTSRIGLATGTLVPHRHPVHTALLLASLDFIAGPSRITVGMGLGSFDHEFQAVGMAGWDRREVIREQVEIMRGLWSGETMTYKGNFYQFQDVVIRPIPSDSNLPVWYSGSSAAAVRRAVDFCDGWMPGALPRSNYSKRVRLMQRLAEEAGKPVPTCGVIPFISPARSLEEGINAVPLPAILEMANKRFLSPPPAGFRTIDELDGALIAGPADRIVSEIRRYEELRVSHVVFDLRFRFDDWRECTEFIAEEVLPELRG